MCTSEAIRTLIAAMTQQQSKIINRIADRVDLAIDFLTLGQYGLALVEQTSAGEPGCESGDRECGHREALAPARHRGCEGKGTDVFGARPQPAA
jgi:hypothetical protein